MVSVGLFAIDSCAIYCFVINGSNFTFDLKLFEIFLEDLMLFYVLLNDCTLYFFKGVKDFWFDLECLIYFLDGLYIVVTGFKILS